MGLADELAEWKENAIIALWLVKMPPSRLKCYDTWSVVWGIHPDITVQTIKLGGILNSL